MNTLTAGRRALKTALEGAGLTVSDHLPERIVPPLAIIAAGSPYLEGGDAYGTYTVRHTVVLVAPRAANATSTDDLDELVATTVEAFEDMDGWGVERVDQPSMLAANNTEYLSTAVDVLTHTGIETEVA